MLAYLTMSTEVGTLYHVMHTNNAAPADMVAHGWVLVQISISRCAIPDYSIAGVGKNSCSSSTNAIVRINMVL